MGSEVGTALPRTVNSESISLLPDLEDLCP